MGWVVFALLVGGVLALPIALEVQEDHDLRGAGVERHLGDLCAAFQCGNLRVAGTTSGIAIPHRVSH